MELFSDIFVIIYILSVLREKDKDTNVKFNLPFLTGLSHRSESTEANIYYKKIVQCTDSIHFYLKLINC